MKTTEVLEISVESLNALIKELEHEKSMKIFYREESKKEIDKLIAENKKILDDYNNLSISSNMTYNENMTEIEILREEVNKLKEEIDDLVEEQKIKKDD